MVQFDADTSASGVAIIAVIILILYKKKRDTRGTALTDALPTTLMDTSIYDMTEAGTPARVIRRKIASCCCTHALCRVSSCYMPLNFF